MQPAASAHSVSRSGLELDRCRLQAGGAPRGRAGVGERGCGAGRCRRPGCISRAVISVQLDSWQSGAAPPPVHTSPAGLHRRSHSACLKTHLLHSREVKPSGKPFFSVPRTDGLVYFHRSHSARPRTLPYGRVISDMTN
ncbi:hypothetical protein JYU34_018776 [Plutella xylostella]|uniref:Uncharacterized protein n=1 Tax=Plutella xylostella TaxID=51655 RepID=A0ABQ7PYH0_PLUXY|nr:hypothetical protein JYU34_018776 [Plutella xylostella]